MILRQIFDFDRHVRGGARVKHRAPDRSETEGKVFAFTVLASPRRDF